MDNQVLVAGIGDTAIEGIDQSQMAFDFSQEYRSAVTGELTAVKIRLNFSAF
jgi:hypothetical protein